MAFEGNKYFTNIYLSYKVHPNFRKSKWEEAWNYSMASFSSYVANQ